jgi:UDP-N-acetylglucosamine 1-carboxyvinyltransferase
MIEAGTYMAIAAATGGRLKIKNVIPKHLESVTAKLIEMGADVSEFDDSVVVSGTSELNKANIKTQIYPGLPTDMNAQMCVLLCLAKGGTSYITEGVYDNKFRYCDELKKKGAAIKVNGRVAAVESRGFLNPAVVKAVDIRGGVAMVIAALTAKGKTEIEEIDHIQRGYEDIVGKLTKVGADIKKIFVPDEFRHDMAT